MDWPEPQLTDYEKTRWCVYSEPGKPQRAIIYRTYAAELRITNTTAEDIETLQISRRSRVFGMTGSGDIHNMEIQLVDSTGESYTMGYNPISNMIMGSNPDPRGLLMFGTGGAALSTGLANGNLFALAPHIFEPKILLLGNQNLTVRGRALNPPQLLAKYNPLNLLEPIVSETIHVSLTFHVWEFPLE